MGHAAIAAAVTRGGLIKLHRGAYGAPELPDDCVVAAGMRGRLTCVSELARLGVFVQDTPAQPHVHIPRSSSRLDPKRHARAHIHRDRLRRTPEPDALTVEPIDAVVHAVQCQPVREAVASLDSAVHRALITASELDDVFAALPWRYAALRPLLDGRAESGPETLLRLVLRTLPCTFEVQVEIDDVGRVDFVVDGWLIVECDSAQFHSSWDQQREDRRRDQSAAARGYATYRPIAEDIMWHRDDVRAAIQGLLTLREAA